MIAFGARTLSAAPDDQENLRQAAQSPYTLKRFVDDHPNFQSNRLYSLLAIRGDVEFAPKCEQCFAELIPAMDARPSQVILRLYEKDWYTEVLLRFFTNTGDANEWRYGGHYAPYVKYFPPDHKLIHLAGAPFLLITQQGNAGSGLSTKVQDWFDLNRAQFEPALSNFVSGRIVSHPQHFGREIDSQLVSFQGGMVEQLRIRYRVRYFYEDYDDTKLIDLGTRTVEAVYSRAPGKEFQFDSKLSAVSKDEIDTVFGSFDPDMSNEEFLRYNLTNLKGIAIGQPSRAKNWLVDFLKYCRETPEGAQLQGLLAAK